MNVRKNINGSSTANLNKRMFKAAPKIVTASLVLLLFATLFPFNFSFENGFSFEKIIITFNNSTHLSDQVNNVLLFIPLGFGLTCLLHAKRLGATAKLAIVLFISAGLSLTVEVLQAFLPSRDPTPADIINNSAGGLFGFLGFYLWKSQIISYASSIIEKSKKRVSINQLILIFTVYIIMTFVIPIPLQNTTSLSNWDLNFPLLLGNERTGDRPWQGYISQIYIADRGISKEEVAQVFSDKASLTIMGDSLLAVYQLTGQGSYRDQTKHLPDLSSRGQPPKTQDGTGVFLTPSHWLETAAPVNWMNQRIRETAQFTLGATVATADTTQSGPARIVSLSSNTTERNFTLGQEGTNLVFRLRTPINGKNAAYLRQVVPNIFADTKPHHIVITYANSILQVYIDKLQNLHSFNLLELIPKSEKILYYGLMFIPIASLLAIITTLSKGRFVFYIFLYSGILLPSLIVESILATWSSRSIKLENLLISIVLMACTILSFKLFTPAQLKSNIAK